ncbi:uncharacterized protein BXIN_2546 [Babesia sp. Xinjiang]|uniref:uncharacterized protein n=1 Tax=Babesia sp. Xinjiang TaxID=462227 RepID=UPI000A2366E0|nr:uncharacterized protein BXIN_2546 [Babesia sp. Xinjiang]ORM41456.1 hypothetical protein BXIN_2546 [Babesia sp. Xinjiang]
MTITATGSRRIPVGTTLVRSCTTKGQRLANVLQAHVAVGVCEGRADKAPTCNEWKYVGTPSYNALLDAALKRPRRQWSYEQNKAPRAQQRRDTLDPLSDGDRCTKHRYSHTEDVGNGHEGKLGASSGTSCQVECSTVQLTKRLRPSIPERVDSPIRQPELSLEKHDVPLRKWELETMGSRHGNLVNIDQIHQTIDNSNDSDGIYNRLVGEFNTCGEHSSEVDVRLAKERSQPWVWVNAIERPAITNWSDTPEIKYLTSQESYQNITANEALFDMSKQTSPVRRAEQFEQAVLGENADHTIAMSDTVEAYSPNKISIDDGTLKGEVELEQIPFLLPIAEELQTRETGEHRKEHKQSKKRKAKSSLKPIDLDTMAGFYVVNASTDWEFG